MITTTLEGLCSESATIGRAAGYRPLGGFRFGLSILVVLQHFQHLLPASERAGFDRGGLGMVAVATFFVVSGFVVTEANAVFYAGRPWAFMQNRLLRLMPPYLAALALSVAVHAALQANGRLVLWDYPGAGDTMTLGRLAAGVAGMVPALQTMRGPDTFEFIPFAWSLRAEMAFYLAALVSLLVVSRVPPGLRSRLMGAFLLAGLGVSVWFLRRQVPGLLSCAPMFLAGVAACLALRQGGIARWLFLAALMPAVCLGFTSWGQHGHPVLAVQLVLVALLFGGFMLLADRRARPWQRVDRRLGDLSYPLYLNHYVVGIAVTDLSPWRNMAVYLAAIAVSIALAAVMGALVDRPLVALRNRVRHAVL